MKDDVCTDLFGKNSNPTTIITVTATKRQPLIPSLGYVSLHVQVRTCLRVTCDRTVNDVDAFHRKRMRVVTRVFKRRTNILLFFLFGSGQRTDTLVMSFSPS